MSEDLAQKSPQKETVGHALGTVTECSHTELPWALGYGERCIIKEVPGLADGYDHYAVAVLSAHSLLFVEEAKANAAFIVRAVNSHDALAKALERLLKIIDSGSYRDGTHLSIAVHPAVDDARAALILARGGAA